MGSGDVIQQVELFQEPVGADYRALITAAAPHAEVALLVYPRKMRASDPLQAVAARLAPWLIDLELAHALPLTYIRPAQRMAGYRVDAALVRELGSIVDRLYAWYYGASWLRDRAPRSRTLREGTAAMPAMMGVA